MNYTVKIETIDGRTPDLYQLFAQHYEDLKEEFESKGIPLPEFNPQTEDYRVLEEAKELVTFVARDVEGVAIGYFSVRLGKDLLTGDFIAHDNAIYVDSEHRGKGVAKFLSSVVVDVLHQMRVKRLMIVCPLNSAASSMYTHMGLIPTSVQLVHVFKDN